MSFWTSGEVNLRPINPSAMMRNFTWRSKISDSAWVRASCGVLPADMPLLT